MKNNESQTVQPIIGKIYVNESPHLRIIFKHVHTYFYKGQSCYTIVGDKGYFGKNIYIESENNNPTREATYIEKKLFEESVLLGKAVSPNKYSDKELNLPELNIGTWYKIEHTESFIFTKNYKEVVILNPTSIRTYKIDRIDPDYKYSKVDLKEVLEAAECMVVRSVNNALRSSSKISLVNPYSKGHIEVGQNFECKALFHNSMQLFVIVRISEGISIIIIKNNASIASIGPAYHRYSHFANLDAERSSYFKDTLKNMAPAQTDHLAAMSMAIQASQLTEKRSGSIMFFETSGNEKPKLVCEDSEGVISLPPVRTRVNVSLITEND